MNISMHNKRETEKLSIKNYKRGRWISTIIQALGIKT